MTTIRPSIPAEKVELPSWTTPVLSIGGLFFLIWFLSTGVSQIVVASLLISLGILGTLLRPNAIIVATLIYLTIMGDIRRFVAMTNNFMPSQDPLLLVGPIICGTLFLRLAFERRLTPDTTIARMIVALMIIMTLEIVNPLQGGLTVGIAGAMFYLVPMMWFWIGRGFPTEGVQRELIRTVIPLICIAASILGLYQVYYGFLSFERWWVQKSLEGGFYSLMIAGHAARPFAFFSSPGEFATYLSIGLVCCAAPILAFRWRWVGIAVPLVALMEFLASVRTTIVLSLAAISVMWVLLAGEFNRMAVRVMIIGVVVVPVLLFGLRKLQTDDSDKSSALIQHNVDGLLNPGDSSAGSHGASIVRGIWQGIINPIGNGLGSTTMAGKMGNGGGGFEYDVADMFAALGVFGGLLYVFLVIRVCVTAYNHWIERSSLQSLTLIGILISQIGYWLFSGHYATGALLWFLVGSLDRSQISALSKSSARVFAPSR